MLSKFSALRGPQSRLRDGACFILSFLYVMDVKEIEILSKMINLIFIVSVQFISF